MTISAPQIIKKRLSKEGITKVAIIDDAYDLPTVDSFEANEIGDFWTTIERDDEMMAELQTLCPNIKSSEDIDDEAIKKLWEHREQLVKLRGPCNDKLFVTNLQRLGHLVELRKHLEELNLDVMTLGSETELQDPTVKLVFIDYYFEPLRDASAGGVAVNKVRNVLKLESEDPNKPLFVLMSAKPDVDKLVDKFCDDSGLIKGLFDFMPKSDLSTKEKLYIKLGTWAIGMPIRHKIQGFADILSATINETAKAFMQKVRGLCLEDYAYIQLLSLQEEGELLGQYMLWLFGSLLPHIAFEANVRVQDARKVLDQLIFDQFLPSQRPPSIQLAEIYRIALSEPIYYDVRSHPRSTIDNGGSETLPYLQFGDLFVKQDDKKVLMVANAACDLVFAPDSRRKRDPARSIILVPGQLQHLDESIEGDDRHVTPLFDINGEPYRIIWDNKHVTFRKHGEIMNLINDEGYSLTMRLRLPFALKVQQDFAANLTRIGLPVPPPRYELVNVESYCEGEDGNYQALREPIRNGAFIIHLRNKDILVFTVEFVMALLEEVDKIIERHQRRIKSLDTSDSAYQSKKTRLDAELQNLRACKEDCQILEIVEKPWPLNFKNSQQLKAHVLCLYKNGTFDREYKSRTPICLNIKYGGRLQVANGSQPGANPTSENSDEAPND